MILPENIHHSRILFSPLNWGMGHVSRSIPILKQLISQNNSLTLCGTEDQLTIYRRYFDSVTFVTHEGYPFSFGAKGFSTRRFVGQFYSLYRAYRKELKFIKTQLEKSSFDFVISDQRFGFRSSDVYSIFITHQGHLALPWYLYLGQKLNAYFISQFDTCWIIDDPTHRFAGKLSNPSHPKSAYIGLTSRFSVIKPAILPSKTFTILILNGPKVFHPLLFEAFKGISFDYIIGTSDHPDAMHSLQIQDWKVADEKLLEAHTIYSFCGYSTLMDIQALGAIWHCIPTPGQWEQGYLHAQKKARLTAGLKSI
ncbi:MAG: hypothetical protein ACKO4K_02745 [Flavobacteriales bacterium]